MHQIDYDRGKQTHHQWRNIMEQKLYTARTFEIHCWEEEKHWIDLALKYGQLKKADWGNGKVISGEITQEFIEMVLRLPKPTDTEAYDKMTPFFSIFLDNGFSSEHYGTEFHQQ